MAPADIDVGYRPLAQSFCKPFVLHNPEGVSGRDNAPQGIIRDMYVIKRDGRREEVLFDKITARMQSLVTRDPPLSADVDCARVAMDVIRSIYSGVHTEQLDKQAAEVAASLCSEHPDYSILAARIAVSDLHKQTVPTFSEAILIQYQHREQKTGLRSTLIAQDVYEVVKRNAATLDAAIVPDRDYLFDFFGFRTLASSYLNKVADRIVETPQYMLMRVALGIHGDDMLSVLETYDMMSRHQFIHASPTLFNAGSCRPQLSSCFLVSTREDSIEGIFDTLRDCALISKGGGGVAVSIHDVRAAGSRICGSGGTSNGIVPMLRCYNDTARYVDQGGNRRKGAFAVYLEPWHADVFEYLALRKNVGKEEFRTRDLSLALWVPDLFMERVEADGDWCLFCPNEAPGLAHVWGPQFLAMYTAYERRPELVRRRVRARELWDLILDSQSETGYPYMCYKDSCNAKSNHRHLGTLMGSNLCTEVMEYTSPDEIAVCTLASVSLPAFVVDGRFDHGRLHATVQVVTKNLNVSLDRNLYVLPQTRKSNMRHRPIGIGLSGLADVFIALRHAFESPEAAELNRRIAETIYHGSLTASNRLAQRDGTYETYHGSPASQGLLQYHMWGVTPSDLWDWATLEKDIATHGLRNSLLVAPMPTATTAQILGNNECFEPYTSNMYTRRVLAGEFTVCNKQLMLDLIAEGLWNPEVREGIIRAKGSVQRIPGLSETIKAIYKTVWEIPQKTLIDMAVARGPFVDQSQSLSIFMDKPTPRKLSSMHFYGWRRGLKTGMYYLRTGAATEAQQITLPPMGNGPVAPIEDAPACQVACVSCSA